ncbi:MAG: AAA family ATPase [Candidatus Omnitrophota bacterium]
MTTIAIANQKGGCGKTTTAINLASAFAEAGKRVLLIDLDPQSHASFGLGVTNQLLDKSVYNVLTDNQDKKCAIEQCVMNVSKNLDIVPSNILLSTLEQELKDKEDAVSRLYQVISSSTLKYDYVVIDCPPSLGFLTFNALRAAALVLVPIDMSAFSLMGVGKLLGMLELIKVKIHHAPAVNAVATLFDRRTKYSQTMLDEIRAFFRDQMLNTVIRMSVALRKAVSRGVSAIQFERTSNGAIDYIALAAEILQKTEAPAEKKETVATSSATEMASSDTTAAEEATRSAVHDIQATDREMLFDITAPQAKEIYLVGDFNQWKIGEENRLARLDDGRWEKKLALQPGRYRYKFVVDGEWLLDTKNSEKEQNPFGTFDSIIKL